MIKNFFILLMTLNVYAIASITNAAPLTTMGSRSCGAWVANKDLNRDRGLASANDLTWLAGFLSGYSYGTNLDVLKGSNGDSLSLWMYNFCKEHPLEDASVAAGVLFLTLKDKRGYK